MAKNNTFSLTDPAGFRVAAVRAGIKASGNPDLAVIVADATATAAGCFTQNKVIAAPVIVSREHLANHRARAIVVNAGNANACTGKHGLRDAQSTCTHIAELLGCDPADVLVCSTGIIGHYLPMDRLCDGLTAAHKKLSNAHARGAAFARAIMTTDTKAKQAGVRCRIGGKTVTIAAAAKGVGMIAPNMATMLAFITTDAAISAARLQRALSEVVAVTFNKVTVDNHTSTNDTALILASGAAGNVPIKKITSAGYQRFVKALWTVCDDLAQQMAADGEGATKMVTLRLKGAKSNSDATLALRAIADSPLVRTAFHGADPNWGRIISAVGYSGAAFDPDKTSCRIAGVTVFSKGRPTAFDPKALSKTMKQKQWDVLVDLHNGSGEDFCYTCDLTRDYITINADYHT